MLMSGINIGRAALVLVSLAITSAVMVASPADAQSQNANFRVTSIDGVWAYLAFNYVSTPSGYTSIFYSVERPSSDGSYTVNLPEYDPGTVWDWHGADPGDSITWTLYVRGWNADGGLDLLFTESVTATVPGSTSISIEEITVEKQQNSPRVVPPYEWSSVRGPPNFSVGLDSTQTLRATVSGVQLDTESYDWQASVGRLYGQSGNAVQYKAPGDPQDVTITLTVTYGSGATDSESFVLRVAGVNLPPTAIAGGDKRAEERDRVWLDGSRSSDPDQAADTLSYEWTQTQGPRVDLTYSADDPSRAHFTVPYVERDTTLKFTLVVTDNSTGVDTDSTTIRIINKHNTPPEADAGSDKRVPLGGAVTLRGMASDFDKNPLTYSWRQTSGPSVALNDSNTRAAKFFAPDSEVKMEFRFTVTDEEGATDSDSVTVLVSNRTVPVADAGNSRTGLSGLEIVLDGSGSHTVPENGTLVYRWEQIEGRQVTLNSTASAVVSFVAPANVGPTGQMIFRLTVSDGILEDSDTVSVRLTSNTKPIAEISVLNRALYPGEVFEFATFAIDLDGKRSIASHRASVISGPVQLSPDTGTLMTASWVIIDYWNFTVPEMTAETTVTIRFTVTDHAGATDTTTRSFTFYPRPDHY